MSQLKSDMGQVGPAACAAIAQHVLTPAQKHNLVQIIPNCVAGSQKGQTGDKCPSPRTGGGTGGGGGGRF